MPVLSLANRTYYICFDQSYTAAVLMEWIESGKKEEITLRNASKGVERSVVLKITDKEGDSLPLIERIVFVSQGKIFIK